MILRMERFARKEFSTEAPPDQPLTSKITIGPLDFGGCMIVPPSFIPL